MKLQEIREAMAIPVDPFPQQELCADEELREDNIKERETAMAKCHCFEDFNDMKAAMGLSKNAGGRCESNILHKKKKNPLKKCLKGSLGKI